MATTARRRSERRARWSGSRAGSSYDTVALNSARADGAASAARRRRAPLPRPRRRGGARGGARARGSARARARSRCSARARRPRAPRRGGRRSWRSCARPPPSSAPLPRSGAHGGAEPAYADRAAAGPRGRHSAASSCRRCSAASRSSAASCCSTPTRTPWPQAAARRALGLVGASAIGELILAADGAAGALAVRIEPPTVPATATTSPATATSRRRPRRRRRAPRPPRSCSTPTRAR